MSSKKYITEGAGLPKWSNPISHAVVVNDMCFVSGQLAVNGDGTYIKGSITEEAELSFSNLFAAIENAGFLKDDIVFVDIAFDDLNDLPAVNMLFMDLFPEGKRPARTIYQAQCLPFGGKIKVTCTAVKSKN
ncbi:MAG TPA: RidA family protein [Eudoraea sp.]|nr:RidA family protein [Eudoraea sp.]